MIHKRMSRVLVILLVSLAFSPLVSASAVNANPSNLFIASFEVFISTIGPNSGPTTGGTIVTIFGSGFEGPVRVVFGGKDSSILSVTGTEIVCTTPTHGEGYVDVEVTNFETGARVVAVSGFKYLRSSK